MPVNRSIRWLPKCITTFVLCFAFLGLWVGCSVERDYEVLSLFFDGVPNPNDVRSSAGSEEDGLAAGRTPTLPVLHVHKPFAEDNCSACHANTNQITYAAALTSDTCFTCHKDVLAAYPIMHGPVVNGACLWCHAPHESEYPALLRKPAQETCGQCHERDLLSSIPPHLDRKQDCLTCHFGHGGPERNLLRPGARPILASPPTTLPSPTDTPAE